MRGFGSMGSNFVFLVTLIAPPISAYIIAKEFFPSEGYESLIPIGIGVGVVILWDGILFPLFIKLFQGDKEKKDAVK